MQGKKTCLFIYIYKKTNPDSCIAEKWKLCGETVRKANIKTSLCAQTQQVNDNKHFYKSAVKIQVRQIHYSQESQRFEESWFFMAPLTKERDASEVAPLLFLQLIQ